MDNDKKLLGACFGLRHGSQITDHGSQITDHRSQITDHFTAQPE